MPSSGSGAGLDRFQVRRHASTLAISAALRQWRRRWGAGFARAPVFLRRQPEGRPHWAASAIGQQKRNEHAALRACFPRASGPGPGPGRCARGKRHQDHRPTMAARSSRPRPGACAASPTASPRTARRITSMLDVDAPAGGDRRARAPDRTSTRTSSASSPSASTSMRRARRR